MDNVMQAPALSMRIGGTTYVIGMHFSEKSKDTLEDKSEETGPSGDQNAGSVISRKKAEICKKRYVIHEI